MENPDQRLIPGQFVRAAILGVTIDNAILAPKAALMQSAQGQFVYVVNKDNVAEVRPITVSRELKDTWIVSDGLQAGDRIITEGVIKAAPGKTVKPVDASAEKAAGAAGAEAGKEQAADKK